MKKLTSAPLDESHTTIAVQRYLDQLAGVPGDAPAEPVVRALLTRAVDRLYLHCSSLLHRQYPRLTRGPLNLSADEMLGAVVERLLKAMRSVRPQNVRQFFALANQHMRWELNGLARRLDERTPAVALPDSAVAAGHDLGETRNSAAVGPAVARIVAAIDALPADEREALDLVRFQGMAHGEAAAVLGVSAKTIQRRLNRATLLLSETLGDLRPHEGRA